ncbi:hypothetical protein POPTR_006G144850v4 [Populus trichocarpa]|uniref:Serine-threonine/tyrosine-protein kinase catalytic domain-containing protein n=1 Tax=Populus trichocarpa TaxID=3694 RepID=A0A3N7F9S0_POPTR|nr:hypothetical protein POPTR_006G144850v4 [Populus trichocarpa]
MNPGDFHNNCWLLVWSGFSYKLSYQERKKATRGFRGKELLGFDGHGKVYEGTLLNCNTQVAVKRFFHESKQGLREFSTEISGIGHLHHKNLVCMLGWSCRRGRRIALTKRQRQKC